MGRTRQAGAHQREVDTIGKAERVVGRAEIGSFDELLFDHLPQVAKVCAHCQLGLIGISQGHRGSPERGRMR